MALKELVFSEKDFDHTEEMWAYLLSIRFHSISAGAVLVTATRGHSHTTTQSPYTLHTYTNTHTHTSAPTSEHTAATTELFSLVLLRERIFFFLVQLLHLR